MTTTGKIVGVNGNMITVAFDGAVAQNEVGYAVLGDKRLMAEIVRVRGRRCDMQVFESTTDLAVDDTVEFSGNLLAAELGPGMLTQVYDGLQNPLAELAKEAGKRSEEAAFFLQRLGVAVADGDGGVAVVLLHHELCHRLAHDVAPAEDDAFLAAGLDAVALEQGDDAQGCG